MLTLHTAAGTPPAGGDSHKEALHSRVHGPKRRVKRGARLRRLAHADLAAAVFDRQPPPLRLGKLGKVVARRKNIEYLNVVIALRRQTRQREVRDKKPYE